MLSPDNPTRATRKWTGETPPSPPNMTNFIVSIDNALVGRTADLE